MGIDVTDPRSPGVSHGGPSLPDGTTGPHATVSDLIRGDPHRLRRRALSLRVPPSDADDVSQTAVERALTAAGSLLASDEGAICGWIDVIVRRAATDYFRRPVTAPLDEYIDARRAPGADDEFERLEELRELALRLRSLPPAHREALGLHALGFSGAEIAQRTGASEAAVRQRIHRGRLTLRAALVTPLDPIAR